MENNFLDEFKLLNNPDEVILIPLGRAVEYALLKLVDDGLLDENIIITIYTMFDYNQPVYGKIIIIFLVTYYISNNIIIRNIV